MLLRVHWSSVVSCVALAAVAMVGGDRRAARMTCIPVYCLSVTPDGGYDVTRTAGGTGYTYGFSVYNWGALETVTFDCSGTGEVTCEGTDIESRKMTSGQTITVTATYDVGSGGGTVQLRATGVSPAEDTGYVNVATYPILSLVAPTIATGDSATVHSRTPLIIANYSTYDAALDTTSLIVVFGSDTVTRLTRHNSRLMEWEVDSAHQLTPGTAKDLTVKICNVVSACINHTWHVLADNSGAPLVSFTGMPLEAQGRHFGAPFGPGVSVSGPEVETGFSVPSYTSMGSEHSTGFEYSTRQAYPRALVNTDIELTWPGGTPDSLKATLIDGSTRLDSLKVNSPSCTGGNGHQCRITLQGDFSGTTWTGAVRKWLKVEVTEWSSGILKTTTDSAEVVLTDRRGSPYGRGWYEGSQPMLYTAGNDVILVAGDGAATIYRGSGNVFISPPGDHDVLTYHHPWYTLDGPDNSGMLFDSLGRPATATDWHSNTTTFVYSGSTDQLARIQDPVGHLYILSYTSTTITVLDTVPGKKSRRSFLTLNGSNQVSFDSLASPTSKPAKSSYTYASVGSNNANVLATRADAQGNTSTLVYDARSRPTQDSLPAVLPETGSTTQRPVITYRAAEQRGLDTLISIDSGYVRIADPLGNWTRSTLNRWGLATLTWDALGTTSRASYTADGHVAWQEGKVADSTRVYFVYDTLSRLTRSFRLRSSTDTAQLDTVLYASSGDPYLPIRSKNALGLRDSMAYALAQMTDHWTPNNEHTINAYLSNGLLDSTRSSGAGSTKYTYDGVFSNVQYVTSAGIALETNYYDDFGRLHESDRKVVVRKVPPSTVKMAWRRRLQWYNDLNQTDSVRVEITAECDSPCSTPTWTGYSTQQISYVYDHLGRDSLRIGRDGGTTKYIYDVLGRLRMRYPIFDGAGIVDSFRYDLAGNTRYQWTRRGTQITHYLDSRNRDTLTSVPGIGDIKHAFGGPNDELTNAWISGYVDSIGGVCPEVHYGYSQSGLLLADTALQGTRATSHTYDRYQRDSIATDVNGAWKMRYDATRGILDSVISPFGDTLAWVADTLWRPIGPYISNGSGGYSSAATYDTTMRMTSMTNSQTYTPGSWSVGDGEPSIDIFPTWSEQRGSGQPVITMLDSLNHDGWSRVTRVSYRKDATTLGVDTIDFDSVGNISVRGESRSYSGFQLTTRGAHSYFYDNAGNITKDSASGAVWLYSYDPLDRLTAARYNGTVIARYGYDALGRRIVRRVYNAGPYSAPTGFTNLIYAGGQVTAESDSSGNLSVGYTWSLGTDNLAAIHKYGTGSGDWYVVADAIHSVRGLTRRDATWAVSWRYKIYGAVVDSSGTSPFNVRYRWAGRELDAETGLYFFRSRMYDPNSQRFTQEDASGFDGGPNLYAFGDGDPTTGRDPSGLAQDNETTPTTEKDRELPACMQEGSIDDCFQRSGGGGDDGFSLYDIMTEFEKNDLWEQYDKAWHDLTAGLSPDLAGTELSRAQYGMVMRAVAGTGSDFFASLRIGLVSQAFSEGRYTIDGAGRFTGEGLNEDGQPEHVIGAYPLRPRTGLIYLDIGFFIGDWPRATLGETAVHEAIHAELHWTDEEQTRRLTDILVGCRNAWNGPVTDGRLICSTNRTQ